MPLLVPALPLPPLDIASGRGVWLYAADGDRYFDASSGAICVNVGHAHPRVLDAMAAQARELAYALPSAVRPRWLERVAEYLLPRVGRPDDGIVFCSTGTAAVEFAISLARLHHRARGEAARTLILTSDLSYHGSSAFALGLSGHPRRRPPPEEAFGLAPAFRAPFAELRDSSPDGPPAASAEDVRAAIDAVGAERVAAVLLEPVNGTTGGAMLPPRDYLGAVHELCRARGVLTIHDEVLTGLGRAGWPLASDAFAAASPDLAVVSKGLGAGYAAISAILVAPAVTETIRSSGFPLPLFGTMAGNPLAAAVALAVVETLDEIGVFSHAGDRGAGFGAQLRDALSGFPVVRDVRGCGFFYGIELAAGMQARFLAEGRNQHLILYPFNGFRAGGRGEGVVVAPPLNASDAELEWLISHLAATAAALNPAPRRRVASPT